MRRLEYAKTALAILFAYAALFCGAAHTAGGEWKLGKGCRIEGGLLVAETPKGAADALATCRVDLSGFAKGVEGSIRCRGENVSANKTSWLGSKFMLHFVNGAGRSCFPGARQVSGSFDWKTVRFRQEFTEGVKDGVGTLTLGLQAATGKIVFDLASLELREAKPLWTVPPEDADWRCAYSPSVAEAPLRHGVMLPNRTPTEEDFSTLEAWGATLARYQISRNWSRENDNRDKAEFRRWVDGKLDILDRTVLPLAQKHGIAIVIDLHVLPGGRSGGEHALFFEREYAEEFVEIWRDIARRFRSRPGVYGYDLMNEPNQTFHSPEGAEDWWALQVRTAKEIRRIDPETPILVESNRSDSPLAYAYMRPVRLENIIYEVHVYAPLFYTHQAISKSWPDEVSYPDPGRGLDKDYLRKRLQPVRDFQLAHGAKIYVGEFSAAAWASGAERYLRDVIALCREYGWDWTYHAFREAPCWDVEREAVGRGSKAKYRPSADNPRKRVLLEGMKKRKEERTMP